MIAVSPMAANNVLSGSYQPFFGEIVPAAGIVSASSCEWCTNAGELHLRLGVCIGWFVCAVMLGGATKASSDSTLT